MSCYFSALCLSLPAIHDWIQGERRNQRTFQISPEDVKIETALYHGERRESMEKNFNMMLGFVSHIFSVICQSIIFELMEMCCRDMRDEQEKKIVFHKDCHLLARVE